MNEKKPKSTIVVLATMLFLAMFIIVPPMFRLYFPVEEVEEENNVKVENLFCERISVSEGTRITTNITYEDEVPVENVITYISYTPTEEDIQNNSDSMADMTVSAELNYFKSIAGLSVVEKTGMTVVTVTDKNVVNNPEQVQLTKYLSSIGVAIANYEAQGYTCTRS